jgi:uncharacterized membrane protein
VGHSERIASMASGGILLLTGLIGKMSVNSLFRSLTGGYLLFRGATGYCAINEMIGRDTALELPDSIDISESITVNKPKSEVYQFWRKLENLPRFMKHLSEVKELDSKRSFWKAPLPGGIGSIEWEAEILEERDNEMISWQSVPKSSVDNSGEVFFLDLPNKNGTIINATISYRPPAGNLGTAAAKLLNNVFEKMIRQDLKRFKEVIESDEGTVQWQQHKESVPKS